MVPVKTAVRLRRDFPAILNLIRAHAVLHQATRERDDEGRVIAILEDYAAVRELVADIVSEGVEATVPSEMREIVRKVGELLEQPGRISVSLADLRKAMKLGKSTVSRRVEKATEAGYLRDLNDTKGKEARLVPGEEMPEDEPILPEVEEL